MSELRRFIKAIEEEDIEEVKRLFRREFIREIWGGRTPLNVASMKNKKGEIVQYLLSEGFNIEDAETLFGSRSVHLAAMYGKVDVLKTLIEAGCSLDGVDKSGKTALEQAIYEHQDECVEIIRTAYRREKRDREDLKKLIEAIKKENIDEVKSLFRKEFISERWEGETPLHVASKNNNKGEIVQFLLSEGSNIEDKGIHSGWRCIHLSASEGKVEVLKTLIEAGCALGRVDIWGQTALDLAIERKRDECAEILKRAKDSSSFSLLYRLSLLFDKGSIRRLFHQFKSPKILVIMVIVVALMVYLIFRSTNLAAIKRNLNVEVSFKIVDFDGPPDLKVRNYKDSDEDSLKLLSYAILKEHMKHLKDCVKIDGPERNHFQDNIKLSVPPQRYMDTINDTWYNVTLTLQPPITFHILGSPGKCSFMMTFPVTKFMKPVPGSRWVIFGKIFLVLLLVLVVVWFRRQIFGCCRKVLERLKRKPRMTNGGV